MVNTALGHPAFVGEVGVFVNADVKQVRQQANVLAQRQRTGCLGIAPGGEVQVAFAAICRQAQLHADGVVSGKTALVRPLELEAQAIGLRQGLGSAQQHRTCAIRQHPAQKVGVKVGVVILRGEARALEQARWHLAGHRQRQ